VLTDTNLVLGLFEGGRGDGLPNGATEFSFLVAADGVYPFRLIWYEGNGDSRLELYSIDRTTFKRTLINDPGSPGSIKAFVSRSAQVFVPTVAITSPGSGTLYPTEPTNVTLTADASVVNGQIAKVEFFYGATNKIGEKATFPYSVTWSNVSRGRYTLTAKATDTNGLSAVSVPVNIIVGTPLISNVVETGGDDEPTDTVTAKWTGVTFSNGVAGEFQTPFEVPLFGEDVPAYVDRTHQWNGATPTVTLPGYLVGGEYIMSGNDNRDNPTYQLDITLSQQANVYILVDNRLGDGNGADPPSFDVGGTPYMSWLLQNGWIAVTNGLNRTGDRSRPDEAGVDENGDGVGPGGSIQSFSSIYLKTLPAGTFSIFQADNTGQNMYGVVVTTVSTALPVFAPPSLSGGTLTITWTGAGTLQEANNLTGNASDWSNVSPQPTGNSLTISVGSSPQKFYRIQQ